MATSTPLGWHSPIDLTATATAPSVGNLSSLASSAAAGALDIVYIGATGHVREITQDGNSWRSADPAFAAGTRPAAAGTTLLLYDLNGAEFVLYEDAHGHLHQLKGSNGGWQSADLMAMYHGAIAAACSCLVSGDSSNTSNR